MYTLEKILIEESKLPIIPPTKKEIEGAHKLWSESLVKFNNDCANLFYEGLEDFFDKQK